MHTTRAGTRRLANLGRTLRAIMLLLLVPGLARASQAAPAAQPPATTPRAPFDERIPNTTESFRMIPIPGGTIEQTRSDGTVEVVEIPPLWFSETELTWDIYDVYVYQLDEAEAGDADAISRPSKPYIPPDRGFGHGGYPAISMTRHAAEQFCVWLSARTGKRYRLPTGDEWEYAARAGAGSAYAFGDDAARVDEFAWFAGNTSRKTEPVKRKKPNAWGLFDMHGNVAEWVTDAGESKAVARGGSYLDGPEALTLESVKRQDFSWNSSDPQIPKSTWWLADCGFVGIRLVCEGPIEYRGADGAPPTPAKEDR